jgi:hypothetical protein
MKLNSSLQVLAIAGLILSVGACSTAQQASEIAPVRVPIAPYLKMSCKALAAEQNTLVNEANAAGAQVDASYNSDKTKEVVAWVLFAPAALMMKGNQAEAARLAAIRGQLIAVQEAQSINECFSD